MLRNVLLAALATLALSIGVTACSSSDDKSASSEANISNTLHPRDRTTGTRHEIGCAGRRRCY